jgi:group 4 capsule polysaccharide lipoprotein GfcB/YjbF
MKRGVRIAIVMGLASLVFGCGTNSYQGRYASLAWRLVTGQRGEVSRDQASAIPFASLGVAIGRNDEGLMVLGLDEGERQEWYARTQMFAMINGRVVQSQGFPYNLSRLEVRRGDGTTIPSGGPPPVGTDYSLVADYRDLSLVAASAACRSTDAGEESIEILGTSLATRHVVEDCRIAVIDWSFENEFWIDPDSGFVWQSRQYVHPKLPRVTFRVLRPPQSS